MPTASAGLRFSLLLAPDIKDVAVSSPVVIYATLKSDGDLSQYLADSLTYTSHQMIAAYYHRNGLAYAVSPASLVDRGTIIGDGTLALPSERPVVNIDEPLDLEWAEFLLQRAPA